MYTIADVFLYTADQERAHAERFYELLKEFTGSTIQIDGTYPVDQQDTLEELLRAAEHNEKEEFEDQVELYFHGHESINEKTQKENYSKDRESD